ncbi:MAG: cellulase N-terminal Ig-like domain-containing protein [candidate division KSB1 bacterium]|nr:cellulase N-terminal Ig-like domain-containing protein [candidate division KSB1 bacterium]
MRTLTIAGLVFCLVGMFQALNASRLYEFKVLDQDVVMLWFQDSEVEYVDDGTGPDAHHGHHSEADNSYVVTYGDALDKTAAAQAGNWTIKSADDANYSDAGAAPTAVYRKSRVNGMSYTGWDPINSDHGFDYTHEHFIYLQLPHSLQQDKQYTVEIPADINADTTAVTMTFDIFNCPSEAVHTNLVGYMSSSRVKSADLYHFMGDGGNRDYSGFVGNDVYIYNVDTEESQTVGSVEFWMQNQTELHWNLTGSDVWTADFTGFSQPGTYRLAIEGVGCSQNFEIADDIYHDPYKLGVLGYFYMRIGQDNLDMTPVPRRPLYIQNQDPPDCKIYVTDMDPYHPDWSSFASGDKWDRPESWVAYKKAGSPTNPDAVGGHSDALDWDRHLGHVVNIYDLCLAYIVSNGVLDDDDLRIAESGNGIPDILDEARNEVDFWLNLRYQGGYSHGLTNPDDNNHLFQADNTPMAAWANALNSAMLAYCFQISGHTDLRQAYLDSALAAYNYANALADPMLNTQMEGIRGVDFKMMTAAFLYNLTGDTGYEDIVKAESMVTTSNSAILQQGSYHQLWGTAAYLLTQQPVNYPGLQADMKTAIIAKAKSREADNVRKRPSRRGYSSENAWWQTSQDMPRTVLAHAVSDNPTDQLAFLDALLLEADWGLGRNPLNMIQMTTATTELGDKRSVVNCYTSGRNDGSPGLHPGHTPYLNIEGWGGNMVGSNPKKVLQKYYPDYNNWPHAERFIDTRHIWAHSEFTPRQTMRGKMLNYAYLYSLSKSGGAITPALIADAGPDQRIVDEDGNGVESVQLDATASYSSASEITDYSWSLGDSVIATGMTATVQLDTGSYEIVLDIENAASETASDTVKIQILSQVSDEEADYDFETTGQLDDWLLDNWGEGGVPTAALSSEQARNGTQSAKISGNFVANSQNLLKKSGALDEDVETIIYYVWIPQALVDSATAAEEGTGGGVQNYLMHSGWTWVDQWYSIPDLQGDAWNRISLTIPDDVVNSEIQETGLVFTLQGASIGEGSVYVDDVTYQAAVKPADYDFETAAQFDDWYAENFSGTGGAPIASHSTEVVHGGAFSLKIAGNFSAESEHALRRDSNLDPGVSTLAYHVWVPQVLVDSSLAVYERDSTRVGGLQVYLMHNGWQWESEWVSMADLAGDGWTRVDSGDSGSCGSFKSTVLRCFVQNPGCESR